MENINTIVAENLKRLRAQRKLSLDAVARLSGVSKSMLAQIERDNVAPTISIVWKIANGLKISFTELISRPETDYEVIQKEDLHPLLEDEGHYRNYPVFSFDSARRFETYYIELDPGSNLDADAHPEGTQEFITVFSGQLAVHVNGEDLVAGSGGAIRFNADHVHRYENRSDQVCHISMIIYYPE